MRLSHQKWTLRDHQSKVGNGNEEVLMLHIMKV